MHQANAQAKCSALNGDGECSSSTPFNVFDCASFEILSPTYSFDANLVIEQKIVNCSKILHKIT